jgi:hypothetical protein
MNFVHKLRFLIWLVSDDLKLSKDIIVFVMVADHGRKHRGKLLQRHEHQQLRTCQCPYRSGNRRHQIRLLPKWQSGARGHPRALDLGTCRRIPDASGRPAPPPGIKPGGSNDFLGLKPVGSEEVPGGLFILQEQKGQNSGNPEVREKSMSRKNLARRR